MKISIVLLVVALCAFSSHSVSAGRRGGGGKCKEDFALVMKEVNGMLETEQCAADLDLAQFKCAGDEDEKTKKENMKKFMDYCKSKDENTQGQIKDCMMKMGDAAMEKNSDKISAECKEKMEQMKNKIMKGRQ